jgi:DNA-binding transcriptional LysR family regulator
MNRISWDDLRTFLAVARSGRFLTAGRVLGVNHATIGRRITELELRLGTPLVHRSTTGVTLTAAGTVLLDYAVRAERELESGLAAAQRYGGPAVSGEVRLATPEVFGTQIIAPAILRLYRQYPDVALELMPEPRLVSLANREADIAITLDRPKAGRLVSRRLVDYRLGLYASREYVARCGTVASFAELINHPFVSFLDTIADLPGLRYVQELHADLNVVFRSSSAAAQENAVKAGLGLGILHVYSAQKEPGLVRLLPDEIDIQRSYWLLLHEDRRALPKVRAVVDFIDQLVVDARQRFISG